MELGCGLCNFLCTQYMIILFVIRYGQMSVNGNKKLTAELVLLTVGLRAGDTIQREEQI